MTKADRGHKGSVKQILFRDSRVIIEEIDSKHAPIEGISRHEFIIRATEARVARQLADPEIKKAMDSLNTLRQRLRGYFIIMARHG